MGEYKRFAFLVIIGACLIVGAFAGHWVHAETEPVIVGVPRDFYPEYAIDAEDRPEGFGVDVMNAVAKRAGLSVTYRVFTTWSETLAALERGDIDVIPLVVITPGRESRLLFTRPVLTSRISIFIRQYTGEVQGMADLAGRRVGVIKGGPVTELIGKGERSPILVQYGRLQDEMFGLLLGEVDAIIALEDSAWKLADRAQVADRLKVVGDPVMETKRAMAVRRDLPGLRDRLDAAVADLLKSPEYSSIFAAWHAEPPSFWTTTRTTWLAGASVALLLLGMLLWQSLSLLGESRQLAGSAPGKLPGQRAAVAFPTRVVSRTCGLIALAFGLAVLLGWAFDVAMLRSLLPGLVAMQPWTAITITLAGVALLLATIPGRIVAAISVALAGVVLIIGVQMFLQSATGLDFGTDRWVFPEAVGNQPRYSHPGRPAEATSIAFALLGATLLLGGVERAWAQKMFSIIGTCGLLLMAAALVGYLIGVGALQSVALATPVALNTALGLSILFLGALVLRPDTGWMALLSGAGPGAASARMLLPVTLVGPLLLAWLFAVGKQAGLYGPEFQIGLVTLATMALLAASMFWSAARVDHLHHARLVAAEALRESEARYRTAGEAIRYGVWVCNPDGGVEFVSQTFLDLIGKTLDEVRPRGWLDRLPPEDLKPTLYAWRECVRTGSEWTWEHRVKGKDGVWRTILSLGRPVRDDRDRITSWVGFNLDISQRKEAEDALRESEARFRGTFENAAVGIANVGTDGAWLRVNQRLCDVLGYSRAELLQKNFQEMTHPEDLPFNLGRFTALMRGEIETYHLEKRYLHKDGHAVWVDLTAAVQSDQAGNPAYCIAIIEDIGARKRAEEAVRESEIRMRALLDASQDEILLVSTRGEVLAINKAAERRLARRMGGADPVGSHLDGLLPHDQVEQRMALVRQVASAATLAHWEAQIRSRWFEFWFYPVLRPDESISEVAVYAREITEQKKSQADLSNLFQAIQQSPMSVVITDRDGNIEYVNPEFTKVTGYTLAQAIGQNPRILKSGRTPPELYANLWKTISAGGVWRGELLNKKKNGELFWELASIAPVKQGDKITNFVAVKEDITERREMEEQLRQSQKMQAVGQLTGGIAHDFNNLLAIVMGNLQLLQERVSGDAKAREYLDDALWSAKRGGELTHRLLAFARKQPLKPAVIDLNEIVRGMTELLRRTLGASIRIEESLAPNLWKAFADRGELERALVNLAVNARDAMRSAGTLTLETRDAVLDEDYAEQYEEVTPGEYVLLAVADSGTGMSADILQRAFEPFFTTKEVGQGSGLGLSMVYGFVKQSGGHVSIYSRVGQGTCVKLYLPRAPSSPVGQEEDSSEVFPEDLGNRVVLVVEDEARLRKVAVKMLDRLGLQSLQAETAKEALELLADTHVDVLFTDIELPEGMSGTELADVAHHLYPELKVLFTTGYARETTLHKRGLHERAPWLLKPYSHQDLARELKALFVPTVH